MKKEINTRFTYPDWEEMCKQMPTYEPLRRRHPHITLGWTGATAVCVVFWALILLWLFGGGGAQ